VDAIVHGASCMKARTRWLAPLSAWLARHRRRWRRRRLRLIPGGLQRTPIAQHLRGEETPRTLHTVAQRGVKAS
jgi:hypothetical protein